MPGNICVGGLQLDPVKTACSTSFLGSIFSFRGLLMWSVLGAVLYFGWPVIEAIILVLPIPDPKGAIDKMKQYGMMALALLKSLPAAFSGSDKDKERLPPGYRQDFE